MKSSIKRGVGRVKFLLT